MKGYRNSATSTSTNLIGSEHQRIGNSFSLTPRRSRERFTTVLGVVLQLVLLWLAYGRPIVDPASPQGPPSSQTRSADDELRPFEMLRIGNTLRPDGFWAEILTLKSPKGELVFKTTVNFDTKKQADQELEKLLTRAAKVIRKTEEVDEEGQVIGERVLAQFGEKERPGTHIRLFYTKGIIYYELDSDSLDAVLSLEERIIKMDRERKAALPQGRKTPG